jgi:hypothetical protein
VERSWRRGRCRQPTVTTPGGDRDDDGQDDHNQRQPCADDQAGQPDDDPGSHPDAIVALASAPWLCRAPWARRVWPWRVENSPDRRVLGSADWMLHRVGSPPDLLDWPWRDGVSCGPGRVHRPADRPWRGPAHRLAHGPSGEPSAETHDDLPHSTPALCKTHSSHNGLTPGSSREHVASWLARDERAAYWHRHGRRPGRHTPEE